MKTFLAMAVLALMVAAPANAQSYNGTWAISPSDQAGSVQLELRYQHATPNGNDQWDESRTTPLSELRGLSVSDLGGHGQRIFDIVREAGSFQAEGFADGGHAAGTWTFSPNRGFSAQLERRGIGAPDEKQQFELAMADFKIGTLDALLAGGFERPSVGDLVSMIEHGVSDRYIQELRGLGLRPKSAASLIRMRDHGVGSTFAQAVMKALPGTTVDELVALRDHGVGEHYITELAQMGYRASASDLIRLRDHGVSASYIQRLRDHGYTHLSVDDLIRLRDNGI